MHEFGEVNGWSRRGASQKAKEGLPGAARDEGGEGSRLACLFPSAEGAMGPGSALPGVCGFSGEPLALSVGCRWHFMGICYYYHNRNGCPGLKVYSAPGTVLSSLHE